MTGDHPGRVTGLPKAAHPSERACLPVLDHVFFLLSRGGVEDGPIPKMPLLGESGMSGGRIRLKTAGA